jgi:hypothetical protein
VKEPHRGPGEAGGGGDMGVVQLPHRGVRAASPGCPSGESEEIGRKEKENVSGYQDENVFVVG